MAEICFIPVLGSDIDPAVETRPVKLSCSDLKSRILNPTLRMRAAGQQAVEPLPPAR